MILDRAMVLVDVGIPTLSNTKEAWRKPRARQNTKAKSDLYIKKAITEVT